MKRKQMVIISMLAALLLVACAGDDGADGAKGPAGPEGPARAAGEAVEAAPAGAEYAGSEACSRCHSGIYEVFDVGPPLEAKPRGGRSAACLSFRRVAQRLYLG